MPFSVEFRTFISNGPATRKMIDCHFRLSDERAKTRRIVAYALATWCLASEFFLLNRSISFIFQLFFRGYLFPSTNMVMVEQRSVVLKQVVSFYSDVVGGAGLFHELS